MNTVNTRSKRVHLDDLHNDHRIWLNALDFYKLEIGLLEKRLESIAQRNTGREVMAELEHFQNQYIRQREMIDVFRHDIKQHENALEREVLERPIAVDHRLFADHTEKREAMALFEKIYRELKEELMRWLQERS